MIGNDAFQEADIVGISRSVTKHNYLVTDREGPRADHPRGVLHCAERKAGPGARGHAQGRPRRESSAEPLPRDRLHPRVQPRLRAGTRCRSARRRRRSRRPASRCSTSAEGCTSRTPSEAFRERAGDRGRSHGFLPAGNRRPAHRPIRGSSAWSACTAPSRPTRPCRTATCCSRSGTRFDDRATGDIAKFAPHASVVHVDIDPGIDLAQRRRGDPHRRGRAHGAGGPPAARRCGPIHGAWVAETEEWMKTASAGGNRRATGGSPPPR